MEGKKVKNLVHAADTVGCTLAVAIGLLLAKMRKIKWK
jgi:hypothetical protein